MWWLLIVMAIPVWIIVSIVKAVQNHIKKVKWQEEHAQWKAGFDKRMAELDAKNKQREKEIKEYYSVPRQPKIFCLGKLERIYDDVPVFETEKFANEPYYKELKVPDHVSLFWEDYNAQDDRAISVRTQVFQKLGYLNSADPVRDTVLECIKKDCPIYAQISEITDAEIKITFATYTPLSMIYNASKTCRLKGNNDRDMQLNLQFCDEGDEVSVDYDYDKERYLVSNNGEDIGYLPESCNELLDETCGFVACISETGVAENGHDNFYADVTIYYDNPKLQEYTLPSAKKCASCGANNKVQLGKTNECEYCGTPL